MKYTHYIIYMKNFALLKSILKTTQGKEDIKTLEDKVRIRYCFTQS